MLMYPPPRHLQHQKQVRIYDTQHTNERQTSPHQQTSQLKNVHSFDPHCFYKVSLGALGDTVNTYI